MIQLNALHTVRLLSALPPLSESRQNPAAAAKFFVFFDLRQNRQSLVEYITCDRL
jgi:hypothetical protein